MSMSSALITVLTTNFLTQKQSGINCLNVNRQKNDIQEFKAALLIGYNYLSHCIIDSFP